MRAIKVGAQLWLVTSGECHAAEYLDRRNNVAIKRRRGHGSVTHGRQCLEAKKEHIRKRARPRIGDAAGPCDIEQCEDDIDAKLKPHENERKSLPAH
jgi:hypothetical protein